MQRSLAAAGWVMLCLTSMLRAQAQGPATLPAAPGIHLVDFDYVHLGQTERRSYGLFLPHDFEQAAARGKKYPVVLFLAGAGARGVDLEAAYKEGPIQLMKMRPEYEKTAPYIVVRPMIPLDQRTDNPTYAKYVIAALRHAMAHQPVDPDQVHLLGLSMGGEAAWHAALEAPDLFATVTAAMGRKHPRPDAIANALKDKTVLIIAGTTDGDFTIGSRVMAEALRKVGADVVHVEVPGQGHNVWVHYVLSERLYDWLLLHERVTKPDVRASVPQMIDWAGKQPDDPGYTAFSQGLQKQFDTFAPHWFVENCANVERVGHVDELMGSKNVFVTHPYNAQVPCRLITTAKIPAGKKTTLYLEVGREAGGQWRLVANVNCYTKLRAHIGKDAPADQDWTPYQIDLTAYSGKEIFIELNGGAVHNHNARALWRRIEIVSEDSSLPPASPTARP